MSDDLARFRFGHDATGGERLMNFEPPGDCPNCGELVPAGASACPNCGSDARTGWSEETYLDGVDLPGEGGGAYEPITGREQGEGLPRGAKAWLALALTVLLALVLSGAWWLLQS